MLTDLADACRATGLDVVERKGWRTRGHGEMSGVETIVVHHTATTNKDDEAPSLRYIEDKGLSQLVLGRSGTVYVCAAGKCWHAGVVHEPWMGNSYAIGIEAEHQGVPGVPWERAQYDAYVRLVAGLSRHYNIPTSRVLGHKEVAKPMGRKTDPSFDMARFREAVAADDEEDDMALFKDREEFEEAVRAAVHGMKLGRSEVTLGEALDAARDAGNEVWDEAMGVRPTDGKTPADARYSLEVARNYSYLTWLRVIEQEGRVAALTEALRTLAQGQGVDLSAVTAAAQAGVEQALEGARVVVTKEES